jgi:hypothetical protein
MFCNIGPWPLKEKNRLMRNFIRVHSGFISDKTNKLSQTFLKNFEAKTLKHFSVAISNLV